MRISLGDVSLWFDVSGPSVVPQGDTTAERPVVVAVHGGPGLDHMTVKSALGPLAEDFQVLYFDLRGHGRSDRSSAEFWDLPTWADDLRRLCDALGLDKPVVLGSSFGGDVALSYAGLFPDHPGGVILTNTTGARSDPQRVIEAFGRLGGPEAADVARNTYADTTGDYQAEFLRVCYPLYSATPGWAEESRQFMARMIKNIDVNLHYASQRVGLRPLERDRCRPVSGAGPHRRRRPDLPAAGSRGASQPAARADHPPGASSRRPPHHLPRPPRPRLRGRARLRLPDQGKPARQLTAAHVAMDAALYPIDGLLQIRGVLACGSWPGLTGSGYGEGVPAGGPGSAVFAAAGYAGVAAGGIIRCGW